MTVEQPMETAPKGHVTENAGCRDVSDWFEARVAVWFGTGRREWLTIRRRAWPQEDGWVDRDETYYAPNYFDAWRPSGNQSEVKPRCRHL